MDSSDHSMMHGANRKSISYHQSQVTSSRCTEEAQIFPALRDNGTHSDLHIAQWRKVQKYVHFDF